jgi:hypothetical protein
MAWKQYSNIVLQLEITGNAKNASTKIKLSALNVEKHGERRSGTSNIPTLLRNDLASLLE